MAMPTFDCLIIGAGPAGLAAALALARLQHTALVFDSGVYRNAATKHAHNILGWDHQDPAELRAKARQELLKRYHTIQFQSSEVSSIRKLESGNFEAVDAAGVGFAGRKLVLATGVKALMLDIPGYGDCYGKGIFHCLYCHGYEERGKLSTGVLAMGMIAEPQVAMHAVRMALRLPEKTTVYTNGDEAAGQSLKALVGPRTRINVDTKKITSLAMASAEGGTEVLVTFVDGSQVQEGFMVNHPNVELNGPIEELGLETNPTGEIKVTPPSTKLRCPAVSREVTVSP